ncbi:MAG: rRNA ((747)-C(5))-methyltransferase, partial [Nocardioidaceae bacterium]|nr:rRNA ((747)-C(5))-methyltransferase [Nocardioidaceae bacterium]
LAAFVTTARIAPSDIAERSGELKHLPALRDALPHLAVVSVNLQPAHKAVLEGEVEIVLSEQDTLPMPVGGVDLLLRPQSFFQTNTTVADALYRQVRAWVDEVAPRSLWDLYCGVGGFALACAGPGREVVGVESSAEAVAAATRAAHDSGLAATFVAGDATAYALKAGRTPDLVVVNPPRRGIGPELAGWLEDSGVGHVVYSSCNPDTLVRDLAAMPSLRPVRGRLLDMFPQTDHHEVVLLLGRDSSP